MKIECVLVCVNYSDYLECVLPTNIKLFDTVVVVTTKQDQSTINLCNKYGAKIVLTDRLYENNSKFNKGKAINDGIKNLNYNDWLLITDADIYLPENFKEIYNKQLNKEHIYGTHRYMCPTNQEFEQYKKTSDINKTWVLQKHRLAIGVGFFQLVNFNSKIMNKLNPKWYCEDYGHAGRTDRFFLRNWPDDSRDNLKLDVIHLGNDELGKNWKGRVTNKWV
jgi:glycosyltransferase involved in cell wall biosynthesis